PRPECRTPRQGNKGTLPGRAHRGRPPWELLRSEPISIGTPFTKSGPEHEIPLAAISNVYPPGHGTGKIELSFDPKLGTLRASTTKVRHGQDYSLVLSGINTAHV